MAEELRPFQLSRWLAGLALAAMGLGLAHFAIETLKTFDESVRNSVRATARVVSVENATCKKYLSKRGPPDPYPCHKVEGEWHHDGEVYREVLGHWNLSRKTQVGDEFPIVFARDPHAVAGQAVPFLRFADDVSKLDRERNDYLFFLVPAGLLCLPLVVLLIQGARALMVRTRG